MALIIPKKRHVVGHPKVMGLIMKGEKISNNKLCINYKSGPFFQVIGRWVTRQTSGTYQEFAGDGG